MTVTRLDQNRCRLCVKHKPAWWCIDADPHDYAWADSAGMIHTCRVDASMYPVCQRCRDQMKRDMKRGRKVKWVEWSDHAEA